MHDACKFDYGHAYKFYINHWHHSVVRLVDGLNSCQGRLEIMLQTSNSFGQACDLNAGTSEVQVVCRELGCNPVGARRVDPKTYKLLYCAMHAAYFLSMIK